MAFGNQEAALLFKIKGDTSDADRALASLDAKTAGLGAGLGAVGTAFAGAAASAAVFAAAVINAGAAVFRLAQQTADYGSKIKDAADKTGLSATSLSALKIAADQSGSSLEQVTSSISKFSKLVGEAATGSKEAAEKLTRLGVDPQEAIADLDGALEKVFKRIAEAKPGVEQTTLATNAFGKAGADLIPVIESFDGDMAGLIQRAKELGVAFTDDAMNAADEFGDSLDDLSLAAKGLMFTMANEFLPTITSVMKDISAFVAQNRDVFRDWGTAVRNIITELRDAWTWLSSGQGQQLIQWIRVSAALSTMGLSEQIIRSFQQAGDMLTSNPAVGGSMSGPTPSGRTASGGTFDTPGGVGRTSTREAKDPRAVALEKAAWLLGISPQDLAAVISYETAGTFDPWQKGPTTKWGQHRGLIQFGGPQRAKYGVTAGQSFEDQLMNSVVPYLKDAGVTKGMGLAQIYRAVIGGDVNSTAKADKNGTVVAHIRKILAEHLPKVMAKFWGGAMPATSPADFDKNEADAAEQQAKERLAKLRAGGADALAQTRAQNAAEIAALKSLLDQKFLMESDYLNRVGNLKIQELELEKAVLDEIVEDSAATDDARTEALQGIAIIEAQLTQTRLENSAAVLAALDAETAAIQDQASAMDDLRIGIEGVREAMGLPGFDDEQPQGAGGEDATGWLAKVFGGFDFGIAVQQMTSFKDVAVEAGTMVTQVFQQMAAAVGNMVQNWVLLGGAADMSMKKMVASVLAGVAAQAATLAVFHVAMGIAALTPWGALMYGSPTLHFKAAALWGTIAVATAIAGRALAGDSFKQKTAPQAATGANTQGSRTSGGGAYSGQEQMTVNGGRNAPGGTGGVLVIRDRSGMFDKLFETAWMNNGTMRRRLMQEFST